MTTTISRVELYEQVWQKPVKFVAQDLNVAAGTLARICQRNDIPVPARGHWSRVEAGYVLVPDPLPNPAGDATIEIKRAAPRATRRRHPRRSAASNPASIDYDGSALDLQEAKQFHAETLKRRLLHELNDGTIILRVAERTQFNVCITRASAPRTVKILDTLCTLAETSQIEIRPSNDGLSFVVNSYYVPIAVSEKVGSSDGTGCGQLEVLLDSQHPKDGIRRRFADSERRPLEALLSEVVASVVCCAKAAAARKPELVANEETGSRHLVDEWEYIIEELAKIVALAHACRRRMSEIRVHPQATFELHDEIIRKPLRKLGRSKEVRIPKRTSQRRAHLGVDR